VKEITTLFPKVPDYHKPNKPLVPNGLGAIYVLITTVYLFIVYFSGIIEVKNGVSAPLTLAVCVLFGGFMGLLDDWLDLRWRHKAFLPLIAAIPLVSLAYKFHLRSRIMLPIFGMIDFTIYYYFILIPVLVTVVTNTVNQLGGLNGSETICPAIIMAGLMALSKSYAILLIGPLIAWLGLTILNFEGKIFVGNTGSFSIGMTLAAFAIISDLKLTLAISILPYIFNSLIILLTYFFSRKKASVSFDGARLVSDHRRSLVTLITYHHPLTERQVVLVISLLIAFSTLVGFVVEWIS
jgi:UDP-N-acetylglucosamine--dolichyl-phosphate N-acetylglucosaminephosphotransferase